MKDWLVKQPSVVRELVKKRKKEKEKKRRKKRRKKKRKGWGWLWGGGGLSKVDEERSRISELRACR